VVGAVTVSIGVIGVTVTDVSVTHIQHPLLNAFESNFITFSNLPILFEGKMDKTLGAGCKNDSVACMIETDFWKLQWLNNDAQIFVESTNIE